MMRYAPANITILLIILLLLFWITGCKKEESNYPNPAIGFIDEAGFISSDTTILLNDTIVIGIKATSASDEPLTHLNISIYNDSIFTSIDSGFYSNSINYIKKIIKGLSDEEKWSFYVRDREGRKSNTLSILLKKDTNSVYGGIRHFPNLNLGAQNNDAYGSFLSLSNGQIFEQDEAYNIQSNINLVYYYDLIEEDKNTIASPGANIDESFFPGTTGITNWAIRNTTRFEVRENLSFDDFNACANDSLILQNTFIFEAGKRKSKNLAEGNIYAFVTESGIKGLFYVHQVDGLETGSVFISIKMQEI
jgi:hypothetical protein